MSGYATYIDNVGPYTIFGNLTGGGDVATWSLSDHASVTIGSQGLSIGWPGGTAGSRHLLLSGAASFTTASLTFNAAGGDANYISFATGSTATLTVANEDLAGYTALVTNGSIRVDGVVQTDFSKFQVVGNTLLLGGGTTPYDTWLAGYTFASGADKTPTGDPDGDSMTNQQEFAFGLDPTSGASVNPVTPLIGNQFTYTRYAASGLNYTVEYNTDLVGWDTASAVDDGGGTPDANGVQIVTVTVANDPVDGKLFLRVSAE